MDDERPPVWKYILIVSAMLILIGAVGSGINAWQHKILVDRLTAVTTRVDQTQERTKKARAEWQVNASKYADHWSNGLNEGLTAAEAMFAPSSDLFKTLADAKDAVARDDRQTANKKLDEIISKLNTITAVDIILGPPDGSKVGLYVQLADWTDKSDNAITQAQNDVADAGSYLESKKKEPRAIADGVTFTAADSALGEAKDQLSQSIIANSTKVERGIIDKALAYQLASQASAKCTDAKTAADTEVSAAYAAEDSINAAQTRIDSARATILSRTLNQDEALGALAGAESTLALARTSFAAHNFGDAKAKADEAFAQAESAEELTVPTPTPEPVRSSGGSGGGFFGSGGSDSGGSSGDSWSSGGSSGGSDFGSGSDSGSWDSGGSDSGSWGGDSGSDSGSW